MCVFSKWVGVLCNVGLGFFVQWGGGEGEKGVGVRGFFLELKEHK